MGDFENQVRDLIRERFKSQAAFCRETGISTQTLSTLLNKGITNTTISTFRPLVTTLGLDPLEAMEGRFALLDNPNRPYLVPLYGSIAAGMPIEPDYAEGTFPIAAQLHASYPRAFMLRVEGNSMNKILPDGSYVLVDPREAIDISGKLYAVWVGEEKAVVKRVFLHDNGLTLACESNDPSYQNIMFLYSDPTAETVTVIGRVVWRCSPIVSSEGITMPIDGEYVN